VVITSAVAALAYARVRQLQIELQLRDRELAKLVVRVMSLQEVLVGSYYGGLARFGGGASAVAQHAAAAAAARASLAGVTRSSAVL